jgi:hypothetical protein
VLGHRPSQRAQHERSDVVDIVEDVLVGGVRRADVGLVVEIGARERLLIGAYSGELRSRGSGMAASMLVEQRHFSGIVGRRRGPRQRVVDALARRLSGPQPAARCCRRSGRSRPVILPRDAHRSATARLGEPRPLLARLSAPRDRHAEIAGLQARQTTGTGAMPSS